MSEKQEPKKVAIYIRVSSLGQNVERSVGNQRTLSRPWLRPVTWTSTRSTSTRHRAKITHARRRHNVSKKQERKRVAFYIRVSSFEQNVGGVRGRPAGRSHGRGCGHGPGFLQGVR